MRHFTLLITLFFSVTLFADNLLSDIVFGKYRAEGIVIPRSMNDGIHFTALDKGHYVIKYRYDTGESVDTLLNLDLLKERPLDYISGYELSPDEQKILVYSNPQRRYRRSFTAEYYVYNIKRHHLKPLSEYGAQEAPLFSPDGKYIAFARENNLYLRKLDFDTESAITTDGEYGKIINGIADWVYEEEFATTRYFCFSPDSKLLAFVRFDEKEVPIYQMQRYLPTHSSDELMVYPYLEEFKYPKAGQKNATVSLWVYDDYYKSRKKIDLGNDNEEFYIPRIKWTREQEALAVFVLNRLQNQLDLRYANPKTTLSKLILRETDSRYVDYGLIDDVLFLNDNQHFTFVSERSGFRHAYLYENNGKLVRQLTDGKWDMTRFYGYDVKTNHCFYQAAKDTPMERGIYRNDGKGRSTEMSKKRGWNSAYFSNNFHYFIDHYSALNTPPSAILYNQKGKEIRVLRKNDKLKQRIDSLGIPQKAFFHFTTPQGTLLNGWILKPIDFDETKAYPTVVVQYSGPNSQEVTDSWRVDWTDYLSAKGYVVACVDTRGTGARGADFRKCTYLELGVREAEDLNYTASYLGHFSFVDANKIALWGWSYGGFATLLTMSTSPHNYSVGIAVAPVTDWRFYNTAYTERFMRTPQENSVGYELGSPLRKAGKLKGSLLLIHGTADDNVHIQQTYVYLNELIKHQKQVDFYLYPDKNHSILGKNTRFHLFSKMFFFLERNLQY